MHTAETQAPGGGDRGTDSPTDSCDAGPSNGPKPHRPGDPIERHHSDPEFMGGAPGQQRTPMYRPEYRQPHKDLYTFLKNTTNNQGFSMRPKKGYPRTKMWRQFTRQSQINALRDFYNGPGAKYYDTARDFSGNTPI